MGPLRCAPAPINLPLHRPPPCRLQRCGCAGARGEPRLLAGERVLRVCMCATPSRPAAPWGPGLHVAAPRRSLWQLPPTSPALHSAPLRLWATCLALASCWASRYVLQQCGRGAASRQWLWGRSPGVQRGAARHAAEPLAGTLPCGTPTYRAYTPSSCLASLLQATGEPGVVVWLGGRDCRARDGNPWLLASHSAGWPGGCLVGAQQAACALAARVGHGTCCRLRVPAHH